MTLADANGRKLDLGRVFGDTFGVIRRQAAPLIGVTFVLSYLPNLLTAFVRFGEVQSAATTPAAAFQAYTHPLSGLLSLAGLFLGAYALACQLDIAMGELEGRRPPLADVFRRAVGKILPMVGAILLMVLGIALGLVLLIVPGVILAVMWGVALPAVAAETSNPVKALGRSRFLTKGNRWRIFGLLVLVWVLVLIVDGILLGGAAAIGAFSQGGGAGAGFLGVALASLFGFIVSLCVSVGSAALYVQLRELKGAGGESVAQVFA